MRTQTKLKIQKRECRKSDGATLNTSSNAVGVLSFQSFLQIVSSPFRGRNSTKTKAEIPRKGKKRKNTMSKNSAKNIAQQIRNRAEANKANVTETPAPAPEGNAPENAPAPEGNAPENAPTPAAPLSPATLLRQQMAELQTQLAVLASQEAEAKKTQKILFADKLAVFLPSVNCANLDEFAELFREYRRGLETGSNSGGKRSKFSAEEKERILNVIRRAKAPDSTPEERVNGQLSAISKATGIEYQTIRNWAVAANLHTVTARTV